MRSVLVVDEDRSNLEALGSALRTAGTQVVRATSAREALSQLEHHAVDVVVSDVVTAELDGVSVLAYVQQHHPGTAVVLLSDPQTIDAAAEAVRCGAYDYLTKPVDYDRIRLVVGRAIRKQRATVTEEHVGLVPASLREGGLVGQSPAMRALIDKIKQVAPTNATALILGESGTGKELIATAIHRQSRRAARPLVKVNCAALPETLIESELFGHERGAFTNAHRTRRGRFELADGGTLFLDEVGDLSLVTQVKLLRALQEREIERVGGQTPIAVDVRLIAATHQDLQRAMREGRFRDDLFYRLKVVTLEVPPLRERREDIPVLLDHFVALYSQEHGRPVHGFSQDARDALMAYEWPGNVRELRNLVESLVVTVKGSEIRARDLPGVLTPRSQPVPFSCSMGRPLEEVERAYVLRTLRMVDGNKTKAARVLGIGKKTLYRRLERYGVLEPEEP